MVQNYYRKGRWRKERLFSLYTRDFFCPFLFLFAKLEMHDLKIKGGKKIRETDLMNTVCSLKKKKKNSRKKKAQNYHILGSQCQPHSPNLLGVNVANTYVT